MSKASALLGASYQLYWHTGTNETILRTVRDALPVALHGLVKRSRQRRSSARHAHCGNVTSPPIIQRRTSFPSSLSSSRSCPFCRLVTTASPYTCTGDQPQEDRFNGPFLHGVHCALMALAPLKARA
ncbi:hypothetical protein EDB84DRAFT_1433343 [Lactarius hengduanensis]|nr:hypothetical protein EDB84DRAFT_1433343 [Lactarius hengduanensis]